MDKSEARIEDSKVLSTEPLDSKDAKWTKLVRVNYQNPLGKKALWESAERTIDGVGIVALIQHPSGPHIVLQRQFRPPVGKVCIEIPAGLLDAGEDAGQCALRELKEESGYIGTVDEREEGGIGVMFNDPGFTNTNLMLVRALVDPNDPRNQDGQRESALEADEFIATFTVPLRDLWAETKRLEGEGYAIDARVGTLAEGVRLAVQFGLA